MQFPEALRIPWQKPPQNLGLRGRAPPPSQRGTAAMTSSPDLEVPLPAGSLHRQQPPASEGSSECSVCRLRSHSGSVPAAARQSYSSSIMMMHGYLAHCHDMIGSLCAKWPSWPSIAALVVSQRSLGSAGHQMIAVAHVRGAASKP